MDFSELNLLHSLLCKFDKSIDSLPILDGDQFPTHLLVIRFVAIVENVLSQLL